MPVLIQGTAAQWQRALARALAEGLDVLTEPISGEAFVESASRLGTLYQVTTTSCTCPAGQEGMVCKHVACYLAQIGEFPLGAPPALAEVVKGADLGRLTVGRGWSDGVADVLRELEQDAREAEEPAIECRECCGCGVVVYRSFEQPCDVCDGCGMIAA